MSILQDLDPKYAKTQRQPSMGSWKLIAWVASLLLALTWMGWLVFAVRIGDSFSDKDSLKIAAPEQVVTPPPSPKTSSPLNAESWPATAVAKADPLPAGSASGNALIQEFHATTPSASSPAQTESVNQAKPDHLPAVKLSDTKPAQKPIKQTKKRPTSKIAEQKQGNSHANKETPPPLTSAVTKKAAERDIDIISAIVR